MAASAPPDLWKTAIDSVDLQVKDRLAPTKTLVRDIVYEVLKEAKVRHNESVKKRLRLPNGMTQHNSLSDHEHGKGGWTNGTNMELDPFDPRMLLVLTRSDLDVVDQVPGTMNWTCSRPLQHLAILQLFVRFYQRALSLVKAK